MSNKGAFCVVWFVVISDGAGDVVHDQKKKRHQHHALSDERNLIIKFGVLFFCSETVVEFRSISQLLLFFFVRMWLR